MTEKNKAAQELGRLGGAKGGKARAANMTKKELSEAGRKAANARWAKKRQ
jgi:general stress protein YciG